MRQHCQGMGKRCVIALSLFLSAVLSCHADESRPNILFFFADDQRHDTLGCAGHKIVETPTIDRLANSGVRFENMFVTRSTCWASRTTILTGLISRSSVEPDLSDRVKPEALTEMFPDLLRDAGYRTGLFGKRHAKMPKGFRPEDHFDEYERIFRNPYFKTMPDGTRRHTTELIGDRGIEFLKTQRDKKRPFCLNLWFNAGHAEDRDHVEIVAGRTHEILSQSHFAIAVSGTITLEVAHFGVPMLIFYRVGRLAFRTIGWALIQTPHLSLVNILAGKLSKKRIVPELIPWHGRVGELTAMVLEMMNDMGWLIETRQALLDLVAPLKVPAPRSASANAADLIVEVLGGRA